MPCYIPCVFLPSNVYVGDRMHRGDSAEGLAVQTNTHGERQGMVGTGGLRTRLVAPATCADLGVLWIQDLQAVVWPQPPLVRAWRRLIRLPQRRALHVQESLTTLNHLPASMRNSYPIVDTNVPEYYTPKSSAFRFGLPRQVRNLAASALARTHTCTAPCVQDHEMLSMQARNVTSCVLVCSAVNMHVPAK